MSRDVPIRGVYCDFAHDFDADAATGRWRDCRRRAHYSWVDCIQGIVWGCSRTDPTFHKTTIFRRSLRPRSS